METWKVFHHVPEKQSSDIRQGKVCLQAKWAIRAELIPVSVA